MMKSKKNKLTTNFVFNFANRIVTLIIPLIVTPYITRIFVSENLGFFNYANTIGSYFVLVALMGLSMYGNRQISTSRNNQGELNRRFSSLYFIQVINSLVCFVVYVSYVLLFCKDMPVMAWINFVYVISAIFDVTWFLSGIEKFKSIAIRNIAINTVSTILIFVFVKSETDLFTYALIKCSSVLLSQLVLFFSILRYVKFRFPSLKDIKFDYIKLFVLFIPVLSETVFHNMDRIMLGNMVGYGAVGIYYSSRMVTDVPQCMVTSINTIMFPRLSQHEADRHFEQSKKLFFSSFEIINILCIALSFGIAVISKDFVSVYFGSDYFECAECIPLLSPYIFLAAWNGTIRYQYLLPKKKEKIYVIAIVVGIFINLLLNILLIGKFKVKGAIYATIISEFAIALIQTIPIFKDISFSKHLFNLIFYFMFGLLMYKLLTILSSIIFFNTIVKIVLLVALGAIFYISLIVIFLIFNKQTRDDILCIIKKVKKYD